MAATLAIRRRLVRGGSPRSLAGGRHGHNHGDAGREARTRHRGHPVDRGVQAALRAAKAHEVHHGQQRGSYPHKTLERETSVALRRSVRGGDGFSILRRRWRRPVIPPSSGPGSPLRGRRNVLREAEQPGSSAPIGDVRVVGGPRRRWPNACSFQDRAHATSHGLIWPRGRGRAARRPSLRNGGRRLSSPTWRSPRDPRKTPPAILR